MAQKNIKNGNGNGNGFNGILLVSRQKKCGTVSSGRYKKM